MALSFPPECDTPLERLTFLLRVHWRLIAAHNAKPAEIITRTVKRIIPAATEEEIREYEEERSRPRDLSDPLEELPSSVPTPPPNREPIEYEEDDPEQVAEFRSFQREWFRPRNNLCNELIRQYRSGFDAETYQRIREEQRTDTRWDHAIDLEWMPLLGTEHERPERDLDVID